MNIAAFTLLLVFIAFVLVVSFFPAIIINISKYFCALFRFVTELVICPWLHFIAYLVEFYCIFRSLWFRSKSQSFFRLFCSSFLLAKSLKLFINNFNLLIDYCIKFKSFLKNFFATNKELSKIERETKISLY